MQQAIKHTQLEPHVPTIRIAELYGVDRKTLRRRVLGTHQDRATAHRNEQLFSPGEEKAIANYVGMMSDVGFPLRQDLLRKIAQDILNERHISQPEGSTPHVIGGNWVSRFLDRNPG